MTVMIIRGQMQRKHLALKQCFVGMERDLMKSLFQHYDSDVDLAECIFAVPTPISAKLTAKDIDHFHHLLTKRIAASTATKVLVMGAVAMQVLKNSKYQDVYRVRGQSWVQKIGGRSVFFVVSIDPEEVTEDPSLFPDLLACVNKMFEQDSPKPQPKLTQWMIESPEELDEALQMIGVGSTVSCDTETTGLDPLHDKLITVGFCVKNSDDKSYTSIIIPRELVYDERIIQRLYKFFLSGYRFVFHNAKFDVKWFQVYLGLSFYDHGIDIEDTMLMSYVLDERTTRRAGGIHGLKTLSRIILDAEEYATDFDTFFKIPEEKRNYPALYEYLSKDLVYTYQLYEHFWKRMDEAGLLAADKAYTSILIPATLVMAEVELRGVKIDVPYLQTLGKTYEAELENIQSSISEYLFTQVEGKTHLYSLIDGFNPGSPAQILKVIKTVFDLDTVVTDTSRETLQTIVSTFDAHPVIHFCELILDYREFSKILSTYVRKLIESADENLRVHGNFNLNGTSTGRLSSDNPNLQTIPHGLGAAIRKAFVVPEGYAFINADFSQLEVRVAAVLSQDRTLIEAYKDGRDIHRETASKVFHVPYAEVTKEQRTITKRLVFGILYGISAYGMVHTLAEEGIHVTELEAKDYIDNFLDAFPEYTAWRKNTEAEFIRSQELHTIFGRVRRWPYLNYTNHHAAIREAINMPIQSTASDLCLKSIIRLHAPIKAIGGHILMTVHDSVSVEVPLENLESAVKLIKETMEHPPIESEIPFTVDITWGERWEK